MTYDLPKRAAELFPDHPYNQENWLKAVNYLRTQSKQGWILDKIVLKK